MLNPTDYSLSCKMLLLSVGLLLSAIFAEFTVVDAQNTTMLPEVFVNLEKPTNALEGKRLHDIMHIFGDASFSRDIYITVTITDSDCFSSESTSTYILYLGALDFENTFVGWYTIRSEERTAYDPDKRTSIFSVVYPEEMFTMDPEMCFAEGLDYCVPRADVIWIMYENEPEDSWSISQIEVRVQFRLWPGKENWHVFQYEHSVAMPCNSWMDRLGLYQIGPRNGLFFSIDKKMPRIGEWVRDWV